MKSYATIVINNIQANVPVNIVFPGINKESFKLNTQISVTLDITTPCQDSNVYLIQVGSTNNYKIGYSKEPVKRLAQLQTANYEKLSFIALCPGAKEIEMSFHKKYKSYKINGEWFNLSYKQVDEIIVLMTSIRLGVNSDIFTITPRCENAHPISDRFSSIEKKSKPTTTKTQTLTDVEEVSNTTSEPIKKKLWKCVLPTPAITEYIDTDHLSELEETFENLKMEDLTIKDLRYLAKLVDVKTGGRKKSDIITNLKEFYCDGELSASSNESKSTQDSSEETTAPIHRKDIILYLKHFDIKIPTSPYFSIEDLTYLAKDPKIEHFQTMLLSKAKSK